VLNYENKFVEKAYVFIENLNKKFSKFGDLEFFSVDNFPWIKDVETFHPVIKQELEFLLKHPEKIPNLQKIFTDEEFLCKEDKWKSFVFRIGGEWIEEHRKLCPKTAEALSLVPNIKTAFFSILKACEEIPIHRGYYSGLLRYHLAVKISDPDKCGIVVGDSQEKWQEGRSLVFDDTHFHYVWNHSDEHRVVLFVDFERPLNFPMNLINKFLIACYQSSKFMQSSKENSELNLVR
jgi:aspartyl/asparaginyl beta-hydroxylase (cupin superfamily)